MPQTTTAARAKRPEQTRLTRGRVRWRQDIQVEQRRAQRIGRERVAESPVLRLPASNPNAASSSLRDPPVQHIEYERSVAR